MLPHAWYTGEEYVHDKRGGNGRERNTKLTAVTGTSGCLCCRNGSEWREADWADHIL